MELIIIIYSKKLFFIYNPKLILYRPIIQEYINYFH